MEVDAKEEEEVKNEKEGEAMMDRRDLEALFIAKMLASFPSSTSTSTSSSTSSPDYQVQFLTLSSFSSFCMNYKGGLRVMLVKVFPTSTSAPLLFIGRDT